MTTDKNSHAPGPWRHEETRATPNRLDHLVVAGDASSVAWAYRHDDARLIAASPDLYAMLESAACPNYCRGGVFYNIADEAEQCQWCYERKSAFSKIRGEA